MASGIKQVERRLNGFDLFVVITGFFSDRHLGWSRAVSVTHLGFQIEFVFQFDFFFLFFYKGRLPHAAIQLA